MSASLVLHTKNPEYAPLSANDLVQVLNDVGLIGQAWGDREELRFLIGERFLQLVTFMGCAPAIELTPPIAGDSEFCHVGVSHITPTPQFLVDTQDVLPRCPRCRNRIKHWLEWVEQWRSNDNYLDVCPECNEKISPLEFDWRQAAGFGRIFISIFNIYPREAIPTDTLLNTLNKMTSQTWIYFYLRQSSS